MDSTLDLDPADYEHVLKYVLRRQIQTLVNQLFEETGDETVVLSASMASGTITQLGSDAAKSFIGEHANIMTNFLAFVQKKYSKSPLHKSEEPPDKETAVKGNRSAKGKKSNQSKRRSAISPSFEKPTKMFKPQQPQLSDAKIHISSQTGNDSQEYTSSEIGLQLKSPSAKSVQYKKIAGPETLEMNAYTEDEQSALLNRAEMNATSVKPAEQNDEREKTHVTSEYVNAEHLPEREDNREDSSAIPQNVNANNSTNTTMEHEDYENIIIKTEPEDHDGDEEIGVFKDFLHGLTGVDSADNVVDHLSIPCGSGLATHTKGYLSTRGVGVEDLSILDGSGIATGMYPSTAGYGTVGKQEVEDYYTEKQLDKSKTTDAKEAPKKYPKRQIRKYKLENLAAALQAVQDKRMAINQAARTYAVPRTTLYDRVHGKYLVDLRPRMGQSPAMSRSEEDQLVSFILLKQIAKEKVRPSDIAHEVKRILDEAGKVTPLEDNLPGSGWLKKFKKRHPELVNDRSKKYY